MADEKLIYEVRDGVGRITMNRPEEMNAIDEEMAAALFEAAIDCDENPEVRAVLLTGAGKHCCAGGDLKLFLDLGDALPAALKRLTTYLHAAISRLQRGDAPLVIAVNGVAAGGGFSLALSGDIVLAGESAKFVSAYTASGLSPDGSSTYMLPRLVGLRRAQELALTNRMLSAAEAAEWGIVTRTAPDANLMNEAEELALQFAQGATKAYGAVKSLFQETWSGTLETQLERETRALSDMARTEDAREGLRAFVNKEKPMFKGR